MRKAFQRWDAFLFLQERKKLPYQRVSANWSLIFWSQCIIPYKIYTAVVLCKEAIVMPLHFAYL